jgi:hypothetical protein
VSSQAHTSMRTSGSIGSVVLGDAEIAEKGRRLAPHARAGKTGRRKGRLWRARRGPSVDEASISTLIPMSMTISLALSILWCEAPAVRARGHHHACEGMLRYQP